MEFLYNIPDILYKYRVWDNDYQKRILTENEIFLSSPDKFNDPFDASLPYRFRDEELTPENIFKKLYQTGREMFPKISEKELLDKCYERQSSGIFESGQYWKDQYENFKKETNKIGILSLTSKNDNLLMWSHYANSHQGFCVGFDKFLLYEHIQGQLDPVIYDNEFPKVGLFDNNIEGLTRTQTTKSKDWEYEDEYRFVKMFFANKAIILPNEALREVVLGLNMKEQYKNEIVELVKTKFPNAKIYECKMNLECFKVDLIPILSKTH